MTILHWYLLSVSALVVVAALVVLVRKSRRLVAQQRLHTDLLEQLAHSHGIADTYRHDFDALVAWLGRFREPAHAYAELNRLLETMATDVQVLNEIPSAVERTMTLNEEACEERDSQRRQALEQRLDQRRAACARELRRARRYLECREQLVDTALRMGSPNKAPSAPTVPMIAFNR